MAASFIGKPISLISHSDVRYRGILAGIDPAASTIQLSNVYSMGTESRRPPDQFIPPVQEPYTYIIFRASEVKDLAVDEPAPPPPRRNVHDDPAVLGASAPMMNTPAYPQYQQPYQPQPPASQVPPQQQPAPPAQASRQQPYPPRQQPGQSPTAQQRGASPSTQPVQQASTPVRSATATHNGRNASVHSATASLETVERALGDLRVSHASTNNNTVPRSGGRRGRGQEPKASDLRVPTTDFDFQSSNARFDKAALSPRGTPKTDGEEGSEEDKEEKEEKDTAYDPTKSFFDSLSSGSNIVSGDARGGRGGGGRRGGGRNRREEERERNVATFGEPGGVGLMGPGAYVGGWGGYGRRGGGRGRRGQTAGAVGR